MRREPPLCVLVPGYSPFDVTGDGTNCLTDFGAVVRLFAAQGIDCTVAERIPSARSVAIRATALRTALDRFDGRACIVVGHSMGGLDARHLCAYLDPARQVKAIVTLGTPHRGSPVAEWALSAHRPLTWFLWMFGCEALRDLTPEACARRNDVLADIESPPVISAAAARPRAELPALVRAFLPSPARPGEAHDGLVAVASAQWGEFIGTVAADHFELIGLDLTTAGLPVLGRWLGWRKAFAHAPLYLEAYRRAVRAAGLVEAGHPAP
jgi:triacylglycerol lipase